SLRFHDFPRVISCCDGSAALTGSLAAARRARPIRPMVRTGCVARQAPEQGPPSAVPLHERHGLRADLSMSAPVGSGAHAAKGGRRKTCWGRSEGRPVADELGDDPLLAAARRPAG